jgi:hypothetical protein
VWGGLPSRGLPGHDRILYVPGLGQILVTAGQRPDVHTFAINSETADATALGRPAPSVWGGLHIDVDGLISSN